MAKDIDSIHHVGLIAAELEEAANIYRRLGFQMTPPSHHLVAAAEGEAPRPLGTANVTATFHRNFVEVLAQVRDDVPERTLDPWLQRFPGLHVLTFNTPDADALAARLTLEGIANGGVSTLQRDVETGMGMRTMRVRTVAFGGEDPGGRVVAWSAAGERPPEGGVQAAQNLTPEYLLQERHMDHPNGALDLVESILCVADDELDAFERRYTKYLGRAARDAGPALTFDLDRARVTLVGESKLEALLPGERAPALPAFVGYAVAVRDIGATRELLDGNGFPMSPISNGSVLVHSAAALGGAIVFVQVKRDGS